jgi:hypothetical protein
MAANGWGNEENEKNYIVQDNVQDNQEQRNLGLIKSHMSRATRITLRNTKPAETIRPPWNSGSPSPTSTKARVSTVKRSIHTLQRKLPRRGAIPTLEAFSSPKDIQQDVVSKNSQPAPCSTPEPRQPTSTAKEPETSLTWEYGRLKGFPEKTAGTPAAGTYVESGEGRVRKDGATTGSADITKPLSHAFSASEMLRDDPQEDSFLDSELMTSPRLKIPLSTPALTTRPSSPLKTIHHEVISTRRINEQSYSEDLPHTTRHLANMPSSGAQHEFQDRNLVPAQALQSRLLQLDRDSCNNEYSALQGKPPSKVKVENELPISKDWPRFHLDPKLSDNEQVDTERAAPPLPRLVNVPYRGTRAQPISRLQLDSETSDNQRAVPKSERCVPNSMKTRRSVDEGWASQKLDLEIPEYEQVTSQIPLLFSKPIHKVPNSIRRAGRVSGEIWRKQHPLPTTSKTIAARSVRGDSPCNADGESSGEEYAATSRSIINRSRRLRHSRSQSSIKSVKWDPAIIACGPRTTIRDPVSEPEAAVSPIIPNHMPKKTKLEDNLEVFKDTISKLKNGDRKVLRTLLEALKNLESDEEKITKSKQTSKMELKESITPLKISPIKRLNPRAPTFGEITSLKCTNESRRDSPFLSLRRKLRQNQYEETKDKLLVANNSFKPKPTVNPCCYPLTQELPKQEPIWINTFQQPTTTLCQEDEEFQAFCRANNFIPLIPFNAIPIVPIVPKEPSIPMLAPYFTLDLDSVSANCTVPFDDKEPNVLTFETPYIESLECGPSILCAKSANIPAHSYQPNPAHDISLLLEETSEPIEEDGREAKALDPSWGAHILENFVKKYPMTGQRMAEDMMLKQIENQKTSMKVQRKHQPKSNIQATAAKIHNHAAEIQQKLEMILLHQKERKAPLVPARKMRAAAEIQQKLEIMLYKLKEQRALEDFSKRVWTKSQKGYERNSENIAEQIAVRGSRNRENFSSSKGTVEHVENVEKLT